MILGKSEAKEGGEQREERRDGTEASMKVDLPLLEVARQGQPLQQLRIHSQH